MKLKYLYISLLSLTLMACSATDKGRSQCAINLDSAWKHC